MLFVAFFVGQFTFIFSETLYQYQAKQKRDDSEISESSQKQDGARGSINYYVYKE
jgi:hypothetical protein